MNYMGSKARIAKHIVPIIQKYIDDNDIHYYFEPMCGGCNVIDKVKCDHKIAYDVNEYLISLLIHVKSGGKLPDKISKEIYDQARKVWQIGNEEHIFQDWMIGCIGFLCSYNGRFFDGGYSYDGYEHRKDGTVIYRNYYNERCKNLLEQAKKPGFQEIAFGISDYKNLAQPVSFMGDYWKHLIYFDPPYASKKQYANSKNFNYEEFWNTVRQWSRDSIVLVSELEAPDDFECIWEQEVSRSIKAKDKMVATEKLFKWKG